MSNTKKTNIRYYISCNIISWCSIWLIASNASVFDQVKELFNKPEAVETAPADPYLYEIDTRIARQNEVDAMCYRIIICSVYYDNPLIVVDPYEVSPLTAVVVFNTETDSNISIHIEGDTALADVDFTFDGYGTDHIVPVYGLYADRDNEVTITAKAKSGSKQSADITITTSPLNNGSIS